jgi:hypothetical protein
VVTLGHKRSTPNAQRPRSNEEGNGEGGITLPASAAIVLPAYRRCFHALALEASAVERRSNLRFARACELTKRTVYNAF